MDSRVIWAVVLCIVAAVRAPAWGPAGHSIIAELAQRRLSPRATAEVERLQTDLRCAP